MNSTNRQPAALPPWRRWLLAAAIVLQAAWLVLLLTLAAVR
jgi:hypothetical protein